MDKKSLVNKLLSAVVFGCYDRRKPGEVIKRLSKEDRECCKELKAEDFNHRIK